MGRKNSSEEEKCWWILGRKEGKKGVAAEMRTREEAVRKGGNKMLGREWRGAFRRSRHEDFDK